MSEAWQQPFMCQEPYMCIEPIYHDGSCIMLAQMSGMYTRMNVGQCGIISVSVGNDHNTAFVTSKNNRFAAKRDRWRRLATVELGRDDVRSSAIFRIIMAGFGMDAAIWACWESTGGDREAMQARFIDLVARIDAGLAGFRMVAEMMERVPHVMAAHGMGRAM